MQVFMVHVHDIYIHVLKEGQNRGFDPSLRKISIKSSLA